MRARRARHALLCVLSGALVLACGERADPMRYVVDGRSAVPARRVACADRSPHKRVFWGDLHVHTALSSDAYMFDVRLRPDDAYRYAFG